MTPDTADTVPHPPHQVTLLVVDDNPLNREVLERRLRRNGYEVIAAEGGEECLALMETQPIDLVLLDIMMPGLSGLDVLERRQAHPVMATIPVIVTSARSDSAQVVLALELGASDYVTKPIDFPILQARVQAVLRSHGAGPSAIPPPDALQPGVVLAGRYRLEDKIGDGGFGAVYRAHHLELDAPVAIKFLHTSPEPDALRRFRVEGIAACRINHPNAISVHDFVVREGRAFLVMELLNGVSLRAELKRGPLAIVRAVHIAHCVASALQAAHEKNVVHRDIKPANIFLQRVGGTEVPKVVDFGVAKLLGEIDAVSRITREGAAIGTPSYMAPERFSSSPEDLRSDVYSLGLVLYEMLCGQHPFQPETRDPLAYCMMHRHAAAAPLRPLVPHLPARLERLVMATLQKDVADRPTAEQLTLELQILLERDGLSGVEPPRNVLTSEDLETGETVSWLSSNLLQVDDDKAEERPPESAQPSKK